MSHARHVFVGLACSSLLLACVEPKQQEPPRNPADVLIDKRCGGNYRPVQAPVGGVHPKDEPPRGEYVRPFDEDPLCAAVWGR